MSDESPPAADAGAVRQILLNAIATHAKRAPNATTLLRLSEAWAWLQDPAQPHGGRGDD